MTQFGQHIRDTREELRKGDRRYSLRQVAQRIGIEPAYLSKIERGEGSIKTMTQPIASMS